MKKKKIVNFVCGYLDAVRNTQTRLSAGGPKQKSACASRTETRDPQLLYKTLTGVKIGGSRIRAPSGGECDTRKRVFSLR
jgi:hypothetical protein